MNYNLTEDSKRLLTERGLDECWHRLIHLGWQNWICSCGARSCEKSSMHRTFTTFQDAGELAVKLVERGLVQQFEVWLVYSGHVDSLKAWEVPFWLISGPGRFCWLVIQSKVLEE